MSRSLRVRWRAAPPDPPPTDDGLPPGCEFVVEREEARALEHRDAIDVLVDGRPGPLLAGARLAHGIVPWAGFPPNLREAPLERPRLKAYNAHDNAPLVAQHALARADALLVSLPATPATVGLIDRVALARMWPDDRAGHASVLGAAERRPLPGPGRRDGGLGARPRGGRLRHPVGHRRGARVVAGRRRGG